MHGSAARQYWIGNVCLAHLSFWLISGTEIN